MTDDGHAGLRRGLFIDGRWTDPDGRRAPVTNPATGATFAQAPVGDVIDAHRAIGAARRAFDDGGWASRSGAERAEVLDRFADCVDAAKDRLVELSVAESGTPATFARWQLNFGIAHVRFAARTAREDHTERIPQGAIAPARGERVDDLTIRREPVGVVAALTPFNAPLNVSLAKLGAALAMGNTVVLKPSPFTPLEVLALGEAAQAADLPPGVLNIVTGGADVGQALCTDPGVDMISFTGSDAIGAQVMAQASVGLKRVVLELGGKSAMIVRQDADLDRAATKAAGEMTMLCGQACAACTRYLVHRDVYAEFIELTAAKLADVTVGDPAVRGTAMGPLIHEAARARVEQAVADAVALGARVRHGGRRPPHLADGFYYEPTLLVDVDNKWPVAQQEIFGPVGVVIPFTDDDEAIRLANDSPFGLSGAVMSADVDTALAMAGRLRTGSVSVNGATAIATIAPFGGYKRSGLGREFGVAGVLEYTQTKTIGTPVVDRAE